MNEEIEKVVHLVNRSSLTLSAVKKVISFNSKEFILDSELGPVYVSGNNLELYSLDEEGGNIKIKGNISSFEYLDSKAKKESIISKLFK